MPMLEVGGGLQLFYKDWGRGRPIAFCHAWPLNADAWDGQLTSFAARGYRAIAHDRRGHGRSSQPWTGYTMDTFADDLAALLEHLDVEDAVLVGHSCGAGEAVRYLSRHGSRRVSALVLVSSIAPRLLASDDNPGGVPRETLARIREGLERDRAELYRELAPAWLGDGRSGVAASPGLLQAFWLWSMQTGLHPAIETLVSFADTDFSRDLARVDVPTLLVHADDDALVPIANTSLRAVELLHDGHLEIYPGASHGIPLTSARRLEADVLAFLGG